MPPTSDNQWSAYATTSSAYKRATARARATAQILATPIQHAVGSGLANTTSTARSASGFLGYPKQSPPISLLSGAGTVSDSSIQEQLPEANVQEHLPTPDILEQLPEQTNGYSLYTKAAIVAGGAVLGTTLAVPLLTGGLALAGFSSTGVVTGTLAATIQSTVYGGAVAAGSPFAIAQSIAMGGAAATSVVTTAGGVIGATTAAAAAALSRFRNAQNNGGGEGESGQDRQGGEGGGAGEDNRRPPPYTPSAAPGPGLSEKDYDDDTDDDDKSCDEDCPTNHEGDAPRK
ncbi:hypothetical protein K439DRAFT_1660619 [Ramaria rubella]|nr:hypothetical protein K439DRAFT_1660619 [Ramaria rubella]